MFCPECQAEYREGFFHCSDCQVPLVSQLPPQEPTPPPDKDLELVTVLKTGNPATIAVAKSLLESTGIPYTVKHEGLHDLLPVWRFKAEVQVRKSDSEEVTLLFEPFQEQDSEAF